MKTNAFSKFVIVSMLSVFIFTSCVTEEVTSDVTQVENNVQSGDWIISYFNDSGSDDTNHFSAYTFTFQSDGVLIASSTSNTYNGTWTVTNSDINDDSSSSEDIDFNIFFNLTNNFEELNEDWEIITYSANKVELIHISGGNGGTDYLTFVKI